MIILTLISNIIVLAFGILIWFLYSLYETNNKLLAQSETLIKISEENKKRLEILEIKTETVEQVATSDTFVLVCGLGIILTVMIVGFVILYNSNNCIDVGKIVSDANHKQSDNISDHINKVTKEIGKTIIETGNKGFENQRDIIENITKIIEKEEPTNILVDTMINDLDTTEVAVKVLEIMNNIL